MGEEMLIEPNQAGSAREPEITLLEPNAEYEQKLGLLNEHLDLLQSCVDSADKQVACAEFQQFVESFSEWAISQGRPTAAREATALDGFLKELCGKPDQMNDSRLRTIGLAVQVLGVLLRAPQPQPLPEAPPVAVIVDDDHVSCTAACVALRNAGLAPVAFSDQSAALTHLASHPADLVVMDMRMAGDSGFDFYNKIRELALHSETPAIFVTSPSDQDGCSLASIYNSDTQILTKPYNMISYLELALKGLSRVLKRHTETAITASIEQTSSSPKPNQSNEAPPATAAAAPEPAKAPVSVAAPETKSPEKATGVPDPVTTEKITPTAKPESKVEPAPSGGAAPKVQAASTPMLTENPELKDVLKERTEELEAARAERDAVKEQLKSLAIDLSGQVAAARSTAEEAQAALEAKGAEATRLQAELAKAQQRCEELERQLAAEQKLAAELKVASEKLESTRTQPGQSREAAEVERRMRESASSVARLTADLEVERGERRRVEQRANTLAGQLQTLHDQLRQHLESGALSSKRLAELEQQVRQRDESMHRTNGDLQKEKMERQLVEQQLKTSADLCVQLRNCLSSFEVAKKGYKRTQDEMQSRLQTLQTSYKESEAKLQKESSERQRLDEALQVAQRELQEYTEKSTLRVAELEMALEAEKAERTRIETDALETRVASLDSARANLAMANKLQREFGEPVDQLKKTACRILESPLDPEVKKLVESALENIILLQGSLQDIGNSVSPTESPDAPQESQPVSGAQDLAA